MSSGTASPAVGLTMQVVRLQVPVVVVAAAEATILLRLAASPTRSQRYKMPAILMASRTSIASYETIYQSSCIGAQSLREWLSGPVGNPPSQTERRGVGNEGLRSVTAWLWRFGSSVCLYTEKCGLLRSSCHIKLVDNARST